MGRTRTVALAALLASLIAGIGVAPAVADDFGTNNANTGPFADSGFHTFCWAPNFDVALQNNATSAMANLDNQTDMSDVFDGNCTSITTDIWWFDADLPGIRGRYVCQEWVSATVCDSGDVTLDPAELNIGNNDEEDTTKTSCHEVGHSVGLTHADDGNDCMRNGEMPSLDFWWRQYSAHHRFHINSRY